MKIKSPVSIIFNDIVSYNSIVLVWRIKNVRLICSIKSHITWKNIKKTWGHIRRKIKIKLNNWIWWFMGVVVDGFINKQVMTVSVKIYYPVHSFWSIIYVRFTNFNKTCFCTIICVLSFIKTYSVFSLKPIKHSKLVFNFVRLIIINFTKWWI